MNLDVSFWKSVKQLRNPVLFVPDLLLFFFTLIISVALFKFSGLNQMVESFTVTEGFQMGMFKDILFEKWVRLAMSAVFFFVMTFLFGVGADALRFSLIKDVMHHKKPVLKDAWKSGKPLLWNIVLMKVCVYLISFAVLFAILLFSGLIYLFIGDTNSPWFLALVGIFGVSLLIVMKVLLVYRYPILFLEKKRYPVDVLRESFKFARANLSYTLLMVLLLSVTLVGFSLLTSPVIIVMDYLQKLITIGGLAVLFGYFTRLVTTLINLVYSIWMHLFVFNCYLNKKKD